MVHIGLCAAGQHVADFAVNTIAYTPIYTLVQTRLN